MFTVKTEWYGDKWLQDIERACKDAPFCELCNPNFILEEFVTASGIEKETETEIALQSPEWNKFVSENTEFEAWQDMLNAAAMEQIQKAME